MPCYHYLNRTGLLIISLGVGVLPQGRLNQDLLGIVRVGCGAPLRTAQDVTNPHPGAVLFEPRLHLKWSYLIGL